MTRVLTLSLKGEYFNAILRGEKTEEYREVKPYWTKRLVGQTYDAILLTWGYPAADDHSRRLELPWQGFTEKTITHPHFGNRPLRVYAINVQDW